MCLMETSKITDTGKQNGIGWKVFSKRSEGLFGEMYHAGPHKKPYPVGKWIQCGRSHPRKYQAGFHVFLSRKSAMSWKDRDGGLTVRKVKFRGAHTEGLLMGSTCIVTHEILIVPTGRKGVKG